MSVGDVNGDGRPDVIMLLRSAPSGAVSSRLHMPRNNGCVGLVGGTVVEPRSAAATATVGDADGGGRGDMLFARPIGPGVVLKDTDGRLQTEQLFESGFGNLDDVDALALLDPNADGLSDVVVGGSG